jgi:hypothetical protein
MQSIKKLGWSLACLFLIMLSLTACRGGEPPGVVVDFPAPAGEAVALIIKYQAKSSYHGSARVAVDCYVKEYRRGARAIKVDYSAESSDYFFHVFILSTEYYPLLFDSRDSLRSGLRVPEKILNDYSRKLVSGKLYAIESIPDLNSSLKSCGDIKSGALQRLATRYQDKFGYFENLNVLALNFRGEQ